MSTRESRQDKKGTKDFGKISVEEQKKLSRENMNEEESEKTNEGLALEAARELDRKRADPDNYSGQP